MQTRAVPRFFVQAGSGDGAAGHAIEMKSRNDTTADPITPDPFVPMFCETSCEQGRESISRYSDERTSSRPWEYALSRARGREF